MTPSKGYIMDQLRPERNQRLRLASFNFECHTLPAFHPTIRATRPTTPHPTDNET